MLKNGLQDKSSAMSCVFAIRERRKWEIVICYLEIMLLLQAYEAGV